MRSLIAVWTVVMIAVVQLVVYGDAQVYTNTFDTADALSQFTILGESFISDYNPPVLHTVSIESGQVKIQNGYYFPNGPDKPPMLSGRAALMLSTSSYKTNYNSTLARNTDIVSWSFNVSNQDDGFWNNGFAVVLACTKQDPYDVGAKGYYFKGGLLTSKEIALIRFDYGLGGGQQNIIYITNGLGVLPEKGSFKITYTPSNNLWKLFGVVGNDYVNPQNVSTLLGQANNSTYTNTATPYVGLVGSNAGIDYFDNFSFTGIPEPCTIAMFGLGALILTRTNKKARQLIW